MVDYDRGRITLNSVETIIKEFRVCFMTPSGLCWDYQEAKEAVAALGDDVPMNMTITPLCVAVGENGQYEILLSNRS